jgi:UDP-N-acetylmuramate--alanine ligase
MSKHYHLIGIGGIGMSGVAHLLLQRGFKVSGSDLSANRNTEELRFKGAEIFLGHKAENVGGADLVVYSSAIHQDNPEIIEARRQNIPLLKRAEVLAELMQDKIVITVTGSHGKTTTTSLVSCLLLEAGLMPTVAIGGILRNIESNACLGRGDFFVAEADESDGSFLHYRPKYSLITNIDYEHLDYYQSFENELAAFGEFIQQTPDDGCVFGCFDDVNLRRMLVSLPKRHILFGLTDQADIYPEGVKLQGLSSEFDCFYKHKLVNRFYLTLGGMHNVSNALAVIALGLELGIETKTIRKVLCDYQGAARRLEIRFNADGYLLLDDYAHHPTEIKATLMAVKNLKHKRIIAIFQPHRYTRTQLLLPEFGKSFAAADYVVITDIYAASEAPIEGVSGRSIYDKIKEYAPDKEAVFLAKGEIAAHILKIIKSGDLIITLGAGDITKINESLAEGLKLR